MGFDAELTQNVKGTLPRTHVTSWAPRRPRLCVLPWRFTGTAQKKWARAYRCEEVYKRLDRWCAINGHPYLAACLTELYQALRWAGMQLVKQGCAPDVHLCAAVRFVKSHKRHRRQTEDARWQLLYRHVRFLAAAGLVVRDGRWLTFIDASEITTLKSIGQIAPQTSSTKPVFFDESHPIGKSIGQNTHQSDLAGCVIGTSLKSLRGGLTQRGKHSFGQPRGPGGRFGTPTPQPPCRPEAGSKAQRASHPPCLKTDLPPCNPMHPEAERSDAPPPTPDDSVAGEKTLGEAESVAVASFLARVGKLSSPEERETLAQKQAEQAAYDARMAAARTAAAARRAAPPRESTPPRRPPPVTTQPRAMVRRQQGAVIPPGATLTHERIRARVAVLTGRSVADATADPGAIEKTPATRSELLAAVPQLAWDRTLVGKLLHRQVSALAAWHAWAAAFGGGVPPGGNYFGRMLKNAEHYQAYFRGERGGWCPYQALLGRTTGGFNPRAL